MKKINLLLCFMIAFSQFGLMGFTNRSNPGTEPIKSQAGYYEIEPIAFSFQNQGPKLEFTSSKARIFYSFHPADKMPTRKPLFVFINGGPGCPTSDYFLAYNTSPFTMDKNRTKGKAIMENPLSWTQMGNLLYIDAPNAGFSYSLSDDPSNPTQRQDAFDAQNFNPFIDAAQVSRVVLRFLSDHPGIEKNPVIIVGESYAGTRVSSMLNFLLYYPSYGDGSRIYQDKTLSAEIQKHFDKVFPENSGKPFSPAMVARQFGRQILIEPELTGKYATEITGVMLEQKDSPIYKIAAEVKKKYVTCAEGAPGLEGMPCNPTLNAIVFLALNGRDPYAMSKPIAWAHSIDEFIGANLNHAPILSQLLGQDVSTIPYFSAKEREKAFRYQTNRAEDLKFDPTDAVPPDNPPTINSDNVPMPKGGAAWMWCANLVKNNIQTPANISSKAGAQDDTLAKVLGPLKEWDDYFVDCSHSIYYAYFFNKATKAGYQINPESPIFGEMFLQNLPFVETFLTEAAQDVMIYAPSVPPSFKKYTDIVADVQVTHGNTKQRDGFVTITYKPDSIKGISTPQNRTIFFPYYGESGHSVSLFQPEELFTDVKEWLSWANE
ncbi:MAG: hypothetical protein WCI88_07700 [Chloroflexota bacterium]